MNPRQFALLLNVNAANDAQRVILLPSYKCGYFKRNFFFGTNVEEDIMDVAFPVFRFAKTTTVVV